MWLPGRELKGLVEMPRDQKGPRQGELEVESGRGMEKHEKVDHHGSESQTHLTGPENQAPWALALTQTTP